MLEITSLNDVRGNNVVIYAIKTLLSKGSFPKVSIMAGSMGVGKSTVAKIVADEINKEGEFATQVYNFGNDVDLDEINTTVFKMNPAVPRAFIFEEIHGLSRSQQTALLNMLDSQPSNVRVICTTTELHHILNTIKSRAAVWEFKLLGEKQLSMLLDDYLKERGVTLSNAAKLTLLKSCFGVPRDLLKNTDLAIAGEFTETQLDDLMGRVSEDLIFSLLCSLKSRSVDFASNITALTDSIGSNKLSQLRDFYTRFLLESRGIEGATISREKITTLQSLLSGEEIEKIGRALIRATSDTLVLELSLLNLELTRTGPKQLVGQQVDKLSQNNAQASSTATEATSHTRMDSARVSASSLKSLKFDDKGV